MTVIVHITIHSFFDSSFVQVTATPELNLRPFRLQLAVLLLLSVTAMTEGNESDWGAEVMARYYAQQAKFNAMSPEEQWAQEFPKFEGREQWAVRFAKVEDRGDAGRSGLPALNMRYRT